MRDRAASRRFMGMCGMRVRSSLGMSLVVFAPFGLGVIGSVFVALRALDGASYFCQCACASLAPFITSWRVIFNAFSKCFVALL